MRGLSRKSFSGEVRSLGLRRIGQRIPWDEYSEEEIQAILKQYFESLGFKVDWLHMEDRRVEKGVDLLCTKNGESIGIAVKRKPVLGDYKQLAKLARAQSKKKIYIYVYKPTPAFREKAQSLRSRVEFWSAASIESTLQTTQVGLCLLHCLYSGNSRFTEEMADFIAKLGSAVHNKKETTPSPFPIAMIGALWQLKDAIVSMQVSEPPLGDL